MPRASRRSQWRVEKKSDYQWGFKLQFMYGTDARNPQFLGELNRVDPNSRVQLDAVEANVLAHVPWLTEGGIDLKVGQYHLESNIEADAGHTEANLTRDAHGTVGNPVNGFGAAQYGS